MVLRRAKNNDFPLAGLLCGLSFVGIFNRVMMRNTDSMQDFNISDYYLGGMNNAINQMCKYLMWQWMDALFPVTGARVIRENRMLMSALLCMLEVQNETQRDRSVDYCSDTRFSADGSGRKLQFPAGISGR